MAATIPGGDAEFSAWLDNFVTCAWANLANLGLVQAAGHEALHTSELALGTASDGVIL